MNLTAADLIERILQEQLDPDDALRSYQRRMAPLGEAGLRLCSYLQRRGVPEVVAEGYSRDVQQAFAWRTDREAQQLLREVCRGCPRAHHEQAFAVFLGRWIDED